MTEPTSAARRCSSCGRPRVECRTPVDLFLSCCHTCAASDGDTHREPHTAAGRDLYLHGAYHPNGHCPNGMCAQPTAAFGSMPKDGSMTIGDGVDGLPYRTEPSMSYNPGPESLDAVRQEVRDQLTADQAVADAKDKAEGGLERRYHVERLNDTEGKHTDCRFFVLDPQHDPLAREALGAYANAAAAAGYPTLATDLNRWLSDV